MSAIAANVSSVTPDTIPANNPGGAVLTITGSGFDSSSTVLFTPPGGQQTSVAASMIQAGQLSATIPVSLLTTAGTAQIAVAGSGGDSPAAIPFTVAPLTIGSTFPNIAAPGSGATSITISGQYFNSGAIVNWTSPSGATVEISPTLIQPGQLAVTIPASLFIGPGTAQIAVAEPDGTLSNSLPFAIDTPIVIGTVLPPGLVSAPYFATLSASGGVLPYNVWTLVSGSLPAGLVLAGFTGSISGTPSPSSAGIYNFSVALTDDAGVVSPAVSLSLTIRGSSGISLAGPAPPPLLGHPASFTATVVPSSATGKVTFYDGVTVLGVRPVNNGQAIFATSQLMSGARSLKAIYSGSATLAPSVSATRAQTVIAKAGNGFQNEITTSVKTSGSSAAAGDFNGDGKTDFVFPGPLANVTVILGKGDGTFQNPVQYPAGSGVLTLVTGDFNGDGVTDIAAGTGTGVSIILGNGDGTFRAPVMVNPGISPGSMAAADFNGDGRIDLAVANASGAGMVSVLIGNGDGSFQTPVQTFVGSAMGVLAAGDFNGDGIPDLAGSNVTGSVDILLGKGDGNFLPLTSYVAGTGTITQIAVQDLNGDGVADLAVNNQGGTPLTTLLGNGDGTFQNAASYTPGDSLSVASGDFNGDGIPDVVTSNAASAGGPALVLRVFIGNGDGSFQSAVNYPLALNQYSVLVAGDFNGDGIADIAGLDSAGTLHVLPGAPAPVLCPATASSILTSSMFTLTCTVSVNAGPYTWSISNGSLPPGLTINTSTGAITGTPAAAGTYTFVVQVADSSSPPRTVTQSITLKTVTPLVLAASPLAAGTAGTAYAATLAAGGVTPYTCSVSAGVLPARITLNPATCTLSGTPSAANAYTFTITAADAGTPAQTASRAYTLTIASATVVSSGSPPPPPPSPLSITTTAIPAGVTGVPFAAFSMTAKGGSGSYSWSSDSLPDGFSISSEGKISGTPLAAGVFPEVVINVLGLGGFGVVSATYTMTVTAKPAITSSSTLAEIALGSAVSVTFRGSGGQPPYTWSAATLPSGLAIDASTGALTGTPVQAGNFTFSIQLNDSNKVSAAPLSVTLAVLGITTSSPIPNASPSKAYSQSFSAAGGTGPYKFSATGLPAGLTLSDAGALSGLARTAGSYSVKVTVKDANNFAASSAFAIVVGAAAALGVSKGPLPNGMIATPYSATLTATGGTPPYTWTVPGGGLPDGLTVTPSGTISGTPSKTKTFSFTATVTDTSAATSSATVSITITATPLQLNTSLPNGIEGSDYPVQILSASGGTAPYTFSNGSGSLPAGIALAAGEIAGRPTQSGTFDFAVNVTDSSTPPATMAAPLEIVVKPSQADLILSSAALSFALTAGASGLPPASSTTVQSSLVSEPLNYSVTVSPTVGWLDIASGTVTPGSLKIALDPQALSLAASATPYKTSVIVTCVAPSPCAGSAQSIAVSLNVTAPPPELSITGGLLSLSTTGSASVSGSFGITNAGGGTLTLSSITAADGWATISGVPASLAAGPPHQITVTANPAGLAAGYYLTNVTVASSAGSANIPVGLLIAQDLTMSMNPAGTQMHTQAGNAPGSTSGSFVLSVSGTSTVNWSASVLPGANWLSVSTASGAASGAIPGNVSFAIDPVAVAALSAQTWYGTIRVTSPDIVNSPQDFEVVLDIAAASSGISPDPEPAGLVFVSNGAATVPPQTVQILAGSAAAIPYQASVSTSDGTGWLSVNPGSGNTAAAAAAQSIVSVNPAALAPGVYRGELSYAFSSAGVRTVNVTLIVAAPGTQAGGKAASSLTSLPSGPACSPTSLVATQVSLVNNFAQSTGLPVPLSLYLFDDCGAPVLNAQAGVDFSNGDPSLTLTQVGSTGIYWGTWTPLNAASQAAVSARATAPGLTAAATQVTGEVTGSSIPTLTEGGTVHVFDSVVGAALSPGTIVEIYGSNLAAQSSPATTVPLPLSLGGASVTIGGYPAPLYYAGPNQIDAQIPVELTKSGRYQVVVASGGGQSTPGTIATAPVSPGIAAYGNGAVIAQHADYSLVTESSPAAPGEYVVIYLSGMGLTNAVVADGAASPSDPLGKPLTVPTLTLNGISIPIYFAGLTPGYVGLYQMNFQIPAGTPNRDLSLVVSQNGQTSNSTVLPVHN
ncbi:MAG TPA: putative Ig domain-containing protein [Bryobacteraceae bacterium]|nr:putative Ig domain-containing protein [Bryobacteraceae bacterium]